MQRKLICILLGLFLMLPVGLFADWQPTDGHKMHFPQLPNEAGWDVNATQPVVLADDWLCTETGPITDIHFWGSWKNGIEGQIVSFFIAIHADIPADPPLIPYSRPGVTLWEKEIVEFMAPPIDPPSMEGWYDPSTGDTIYNDHQAYFQYNIFLEENDWFPQVEGTIYWLSISAILADPQGTQWGWKSSLDHWNDDAVWAYWGELNWIDIWEPSPQSEIRTNMFWVAFDPTGMIIPPNSGGTDYYDDGTSINGWYFYPGSDWWSIWFYDHPYEPERRKVAHIEWNMFLLDPLMPENFVEIAVNWSTDQWSIDQPPPDSIPPLPGADEGLYIGRQIIYSGPVIEGTHEFEWLFPDYNPEWVSIDIRGFNVIIPEADFNYIVHDCQQSLDLSFVVNNNESEEFDFGDAPDPTYPTLAVNNGANHLIVPGIFLGAFIDPEADGQPIATALGDDNNPLVPDDEDGVVITSLVIVGGIADVKVTASIAGFLNAWVDFNADGDWADIGEQIFTNQALVPGINYLNFVTPAGATVGTTYSRFRYDTGGGLTYTGSAPDGEVEDYRIFIQRPIDNVKMHWPQYPDLDNTGMDVDMSMTPLGDDFLCIESGPITDIHFWGSFANDILPPDNDPGNLTLQVSIYSDIPAGVQAPWSMPGELLWSLDLSPSMYTVTQVTDNNPEDWYDPITGLWINDNHLNCYQYDIYIDAADAFIQEEGTIYWLVIADLFPEQYMFGWKTTKRDLHWNDDAVWWIDPPIIWQEMRYPLGHEFMEETFDLAFMITGGGGQPCDCTPGDADGSGAIDISDAVYIIAYIFGGGPAPTPYALCSGDADCSCAVDISDAVYLIAYIFGGGPAPCSCQAWLATCGPPLR